jgi:ZIP family zinc transporter
MNAILDVFLLSMMAGLGCSLGGLLAVLGKPGKRTFGLLMGITAGVMISLAFLELVKAAWAIEGYWTATLGFGAGAFCMLLIDVSIPHIRFGEREAREQDRNGRQALAPPARPGRHRFGRIHRAWTITDPPLFNSGILLAIGIAIHNLPEGIAIGAGYLHEPQFGFFIALAIMLHNIPEGIATALPLRTSGVRKACSFLAAFLSGMVEPFGALMAALFLNTFRALVPGALAFAGGVMVFITLDELIPAAREHGHQHATAVGIILGSLLVFLLSGFLGV